MNPKINFKNLNSELNQNNLFGTELIEIGIKDDGKLKHLTLKIDNELFLIDSSFKGLDTANLSYELNTKTLTNGEHIIEATF